MKKILCIILIGGHIQEKPKVNLNVDTSKFPPIQGWKDRNYIPWKEDKFPNFGITIEGKPKDFIINYHGSFK